MSMARDKITVIDGGKTGGRPPSGGGGDAGADDWRVRLTRNRDGKIVANTHNIAMILEHDEALTGLFGLDEFANRVVLHRSPPWRGANAGEFAETDAVELSAWLGVGVADGGYEMTVKSSLVMEVVEAVARRHKFHPVRDYLNGLAWDGEERIPHLFPKHFGTPDDEYHQRVAVIFMISAAARILRPGCKVDTMLVLEGGQGLGKTSVTQLLFGGDRWYMDAQRSPAEKDFYQDLQGKWGVEIGEMTSFSKAEANKVKQTLSATSDTYRPSYGRYSRTFPRQCVFVGTTNECEWQRDHTGGRRYLPVAVERVDIADIAQMRDQLWAEAVARLARGEEWWTMPQKAKEQQADRFIEDPWAQPILVWLSGLSRGDSYVGLQFAQIREPSKGGQGEVVEVSVADVMARALHIDTGRMDRVGQMRVAAILTHMGWQSYRTAKFGRQARLWYAPPEWQPLRRDKSMDDGGDDAL